MGSVPDPKILHCYKQTEPLFITQKYWELILKHSNACGICFTSLLIAIDYVNKKTYLYDCS